MSSRKPALDRHPARDDTQLRIVVEDAAMGRWEGARELLTSTGTNWDRRIFRLQVLARMGVRLTFAETWAQAEPRSPHALALLAHVQALRSMATVRGQGRNQEMERAWEACDAACEALPKDPAPYVVMLALIRFHSPARDRQWRATVREVWKQVEQRDPWNREAHHELLTYLFPSWHGTGGEVFHWCPGTLFPGPARSARTRPSPRCPCRVSPPTHGSRRAPLRADDSPLDGQSVDLADLGQLVGLSRPEHPACRVL